MSAANKNGFPFDAISIIVASLLFASLTIWFGSEAAEKGDIFVALLLLPSLSFLVTRAMISLQTKPDGPPPPKTLIAGAVLLEFVKVFLLGLFAFLSPSPRALLPSGLATFLASVSIFFALATAILTFALAASVSQALEPEKWEVGAVGDNLEHLEKLAKWLQGKRVTALTSSFASFLLVSCFFAMAVAFDDRSAAGPALHSAVATALKEQEPPVVPPEPGTVQFSVPPQPVHLKVTEKSSTPSVGKHEHEHETFYFQKGKAELMKASDPWPDLPADCPEIERSIRTEGESTVSRNLRALCRASLWFDKRWTGQPQRIVIVGHANKETFPSERPVPLYLSNTELAVARAQQVFIALSRIAGKVESDDDREICSLVQWHVTAGSSEAIMLKTPIPGESDSLLSVEVEREVFPVPSAAVQEATFTLVARHIPGRNPTPETPPPPPPPPDRGELLDYLYFMIYTITTTGYGDLMPITPMTKFIVSIANLTEVIYLGMIFSLIVMRRDLPGIRRNKRNGVVRGGVTPPATADKEVGS